MKTSINKSCQIVYKMFIYCDRNRQRNGEKLRQRERQREGEREIHLYFTIFSTRT